jgi:hypothetical protein
MFDPSSRAERSRIPFPTRAKPDAVVDEPLPVAAPAEAPAVAAVVADQESDAPVAPVLRNPDLPAVEVETYKATDHEEFSLSPRHPAAAPGTDDFAEPPLGMNGSGTGVHETALDTVARPVPAQEYQPKTSYFDAMWPAEDKPARLPASEEAPVKQPSEAPPEIAATPDVQPPLSGNGKTVAILKSGVVDGMGYTLYVDGSIEAELPQGTLHFTSINDLREHLARSS